MSRDPRTSHTPRTSRPFHPSRRATLLAVPAAVLLALAPTAASAYPNPGTVTGATVVHDPTMIRTSAGRYLLYATGGALSYRTSTDRIAFGAGGDAFSTRPSWWSQYGATEAWAPDISYQGGKYLMYYSVSTFGSNKSAIGLAGSTTGLPGSWADHGIVYSSSASNDYNAIDPNLFVDDDGTWWLSFGSWWTGLKMIQINPSTGKQLAGDTTRYSLASRPTATKAVEAPFVVKRGGFYYLFASYDTCCAGTGSTYKVKVGRATSVTGPYHDRNGVALMNNGGTPVLESHGRYIGPGGQSIMKDADGDLIVYHYYDGDDNGRPKLGINLLNWSGGWPVAH
ncbi:arabinan endo-1,5-alpha-L-arabinosidase [Streptomyces caniscabiei]|uniref:Arabinan endo-1,5-alpha-L-arabinosidase n=1 Tax=Streptomyces caniscabiei TaxID=2746961 RepID=A0ABU4N5H9_9ACTN|nr:arabinan endo-1,5-alpha-L-arabinosidase [Streptomyces caniscabiei]MBE4739800.1 arabinan endo-1,5-alpha-L-arabinosidase [Streptomyces caniscabiei]MBE4762704.1 arabinan endo-1,5-alpha-L-arabinosidase [Streptomyces caniscabiei]MBE4775955.1 arabinan endo-1,5-alpha-L-arabinosidase [Streptomyces caniscabiei]MBE4782520.1 arabinan endo-1,5-alpha-L-arabinosidase [Streptomyces caniscabiei]MBE4791823.1 arabinan endo-1,5-alpha-L-arabinosidase [Streptomyces caniscabiei]